MRAWNLSPKGILEHLGYTMLKDSGSRRKFCHAGKDALISCHEPHPAPIVDKGCVADVVEHLKRFGSSRPARSNGVLHMSTGTPSQVLRIDPVQPPLGVRELAAVLVKHYGIHEGRFDLMVEFQIGFGPVGPTKDQSLPGAAIGVSRVGLVAAQEGAPNAVDAAEVNPAKKQRKKAVPA